MSAYEKWRQAEHTCRQAVQEFGLDSIEYKRCREVQSYWYHLWGDRSFRVPSPKGVALIKHIEKMETEVRNDKDQRRQPWHRP